MRQANQLGVLVLLASLASVASADDEVSAGVYIRLDTDETRVVSPYADARVRLGERTVVNAGYAADIWTSASIDVRTAATMAVTEQRDELHAGFEHELDNVTILAGYRYSHENDYTSHGGFGQATWRFAGNNATLRGGVNASFDSVGRSGDDGFERTVSTLGAQLTFTQNLDPKSLIQGSYELGRREGYQSSPYRFVGVGGDGLCGGGAQLCLPENHPNLRLRHALVVRARRAIGPTSVGLAYRFYADSWGIRSNTGIVDGKWVVNERTSLSLRYRFYQQFAAEFYRAVYTDVAELPRFLSRDREMGALMSHRLAISWEQSFDVTQSGPELRATAGGSLSRFSYDDFVGLDGVWAVDLTLSLAVVL